MKLVSPMEELKKEETRFLQDVEFSQPLWQAFREVVRGKNYVSLVARALGKNKSLISRQLRQLESVGLLSSTVPGVKQTYEVNWKTLTIFWIWGNEIIPDMLGDFKDLMFNPERTPTRFTKFYVTREEAEFYHDKKGFHIFYILEPVIPQLSELVKRIMEVLVTYSTVENFGDASRGMSLAFAAGLPEQERVDIERIDSISDRRLVEALYNPKVQYWFRCLTLVGLGGAHVVESYVHSLIGLPPGEA